MIYGASTALWLFVGCYSIAQLFYAGSEPAGWALGLGALGAITVTTVGESALHRQREARRDAMRGAAERAVILAKNDLADAAGSKNLHRLCAGLSNKDVAASHAIRELARRPLPRTHGASRCGRAARLKGRPIKREHRSRTREGWQTGRVLREIEGDPEIGRAHV